MKRYGKPVGWRNESYRHYLAAKGIQTKTKVNKYFMGKFSINRRALEYIPEEHHAEAIRMMAEGRPTKEVVKHFTGEEDVVLKESSGMWRPRKRMKSREEVIRALTKMGEESGHPPKVNEVMMEGLSMGDITKQFGTFSAAVQAAADEAREKTGDVEDPKKLWFQGKIQTREVSTLASRLGMDEGGEFDPARAKELQELADSKAAERRSREMQAFLIKQEMARLEGELEDLKIPFTEGTVGMDVSAEVMAHQEKALQAKEAELASLKARAKENKLLDDEYFAKKSPQAIEYKKAPKGAEYEFYGIDSKGRRVRLYDKEHKERAEKEKFKRVEQLNKKYDTIEKRIKKDLDDEDARATYVILKTGIRPGSDKDTKGEVKAYGLTTLKSKWAKVDGDTARFKFTGKKGVKIDKKVKDPVVAKIVKQQKKVGEEELFPNITDASLRKYVGKFGGKTKDLRTLYANNLAKQLVKKGVPKKEVVKKVAYELQNTPAVAEGSYIEPKVLR